MRREGSSDDEDPPCPDEGEVKLSLEPDDLAGAKPSLRLDRDELAVIANTKEWSEEAKACLEEYRKKVDSGFNPFDDAFPLWRKEQFMAATTSPDPTRKETYAAINAAIMEEARKERERQTKANETRDANDADANADAAVVTKPPDADEDEACTLEEKLPGRLTGAHAGPDAAPVVAPVSDDPFLAAAASAAAAHKGKSNSRSLMLGRRWYDSSLYPTPGGAAKNGAVKNEPVPNEPAPAAADGSKPPKNNGGGSQFRRPPKLILFPDGSMREVGDNGASQQPAAAAEDEGLTRIDSGPRATPRDSTNSENTQYTLPASHRGGPNQVRIAPQPAALTHHQQQHHQQQMMNWYQRPPPAQQYQPPVQYGWPAAGPHPYPPAQNPQQVQHAWQSYQSMASQHSMMSWLNAMWMNAMAATNAQQAQAEGEQAEGLKKGKAVTFAHEPSGSDGSDGGSGGSAGGSGGSGGSGPSGGSGGSGGTRGSGSSGKDSTHKLDGAGDKADFRLPSVSSDDARVGSAGGKAVPTKGPRSKRPNPNDKKASGGSPVKRRRTGKVMSDAADCLQLLSEGAR